MAFSGSPLYAAYRNQPVRLLGLSPLADQHWAAVLMSGEQLLTLGGFAVVLLWPYLRSTGLGAERRAEAAPR